MNSEERKRLRNCLIDQGFTRTSYSNDYGDGAYTETWERGQDQVFLDWGPRGEA